MNGGAMDCNCTARMKLITTAEDRRQGSRDGLGREDEDDRREERINQAEHQRLDSTKT